MQYGYARVSSKEQNLTRQIEGLRDYGLEDRYIYTDKISGKSFDRPSYNLLVGTDSNAPLLREGDLLVIYSIDRLGRNYEEIKNQWEYITKRIKADIKVLDMPLLDTRTSKDNDIDRTFISDLVLQILSYVAEKERINIHTRQRAGIDCMEVDPITGKKIGKKGRPTGRPAAIFPDTWTVIYEKWKKKEISATSAMQELGLKRNTFYNLVKRYENGRDSRESL